MFDGMTETANSVQVFKWNENVVFKENNNKKVNLKNVKKVWVFVLSQLTVSKRNLKKISDFVYIFYYIFAGIIP